MSLLTVCAREGSSSMESPLFFLKGGCMADLKLYFSSVVSPVMDGCIVVNDEIFERFIIDSIDVYESGFGPLCFCFGRVSARSIDKNDVYYLDLFLKGALSRIFRDPGMGAYFLNGFDGNCVGPGLGSRSSNIRRNVLAILLVVGKEILTWNLKEGEDYEWI